MAINMILKMHWFYNDQDILNVINELSQKGYHFIGNQNAQYIFEKDDSKKYFYYTDIQTLTRQNISDPINGQQLIHWNLNYQILSKIPRFCHKITLYRIDKTQHDVSVKPENQLYIVSKFVHNVYLLQIEFLICTILTVFDPYDNFNFLFYWLGIFFLNIVIEKILYSYANKLIQEEIKVCLSKYNLDKCIEE